MALPSHGASVAQYRAAEAAAAARQGGPRAVGRVLAELPNLAAYAAGLGRAVLLSRLGKDVLFAPMLSGSKGVILRHLAQARGAAPVRALAPKTDRVHAPRLRAVTLGLTRALLRHADRGRLRFAIWGYSDRKRLGLDLAAEGWKVDYLEAGLLGFQEAKGEALVSFTCDAQRQYFDGRGPSDLEDLLNGLTPGWWRDDPDMVAFAAAARASDRQKYAGLDDDSGLALGPADLLIIGQVHGDAAWTDTVSVVEDNVALVRRAVEEYGHGRRVLYKPHPYNPSNPAQLAQIEAEGLPVEIVPTGASFRKLARMNPMVAVNTSGAGLEAAFLGCRVVAYGASFYAGWGATEDRFPAIDRRRARLSAEDVYLAVMARYCRYFFRSNRSAASVRDVTAQLTATG